MLNWIIYAVVGRLLIFLLMKLELPQRIKKINWLEKLHSCPLCLGVWVYVFLAFFMNIDILYSWFGFEVAVIGKIVTGCLTSYLVYVFVLGFKEAHLNVTVI